MTSKLYTPNDSGFKIAEKNNDFSNKKMTKWKFQGSIKLKPI